MHIGKKNHRGFLGKTLGSRKNPNLDLFWGLESSRFWDIENNSSHIKGFLAKVWLSFSSGGKASQVLLWLPGNHRHSQWQRYLWLLLRPEPQFIIHPQKDSFFSPNILQGPEHQRLLPLGTQKDWDGDEYSLRQSCLSVWWCTTAFWNKLTDSDGSWPRATSAAFQASLEALCSFQRPDFVALVLRSTFLLSWEEMVRFIWQISFWVVPIQLDPGGLGCSYTHS